jgi:hypothetical protein
MARTIQTSLQGAMAQTWRALKKDLLDPYRPERHYMRGPGPKWREKHHAPTGGAPLTAPAFAPPVA